MVSMKKTEYQILKTALEKISVEDIGKKLGFTAFVVRGYLMRLRKNNWLRGAEEALQTTDKGKRAIDEYEKQDEL